MYTLYGAPGWGSAITELMFCLEPYHWADVEGFDRPCFIALARASACLNSRASSRSQRRDESGVAATASGSGTPSSVPRLQIALTSCCSSTSA